MLAHGCLLVNSRRQEDGLERLSVVLRVRLADAKTDQVCPHTGRARGDAAGLMLLPN